MLSANSFKIYFQCKLSNNVIFRAHENFYNGKWYDCCEIDQSVTIGSENLLYAKIICFIWISEIIQLAYVKVFEKTTNEYFNKYNDFPYYCFSKNQDLVVQNPFIFVHINQLKNPLWVIEDYDNDGNYFIFPNEWIIN